MTDLLKRALRRGRGAGTEELRAMVATAVRWRREHPYAWDVHYGDLDERGRRLVLGPFQSVRQARWWASRLGWFLGAKQRNRARERAEAHRHAGRHLRLVTP